MFPSGAKAGAALSAVSNGADLVFLFVTSKLPVITEHSHRRVFYWCDPYPLCLGQIDLRHKDRVKDCLHVTSFALDRA
jgi:hypothetical protein